MVPQLVISALLVTLAAGSAAILVIDRYLRDRAPALLRATIANLVLFNLLTSVGLGYRLVEWGSGAPAGAPVALHLLLGQILLLSVLKVAWLRSFAAIGQVLASQSLAGGLNRAALIVAAATALAAAAGWAHGAATGRLEAGLAVAVATDVLVAAGMVGVALVLWRRSAAVAGLAARYAMRWFAAGNLGIVAGVVLSFAAGSVWQAWRGPTQALAHTLVLLAYEVALVAWVLRWAGAWIEESRSGAGGGAAFERTAERWGLSKREREVAALLCRGRTNQEIADALFVALQTVKDHNHRIFQKARVRNRTELVRQLLSTEASADRR